MKIVALENTPSSRLGGQELSLLDICRGLAEKGHAIILLYVNDGDLLPEYRSFCESVIRVKGYRFDKKRPFSSLWGLFRGLSLVPSAPEMLVYSNQYFDSFFGALVAQKKKCPFICHLRLPPPDKLSRQYAFGLSKASALIAVSNKTRNDYVENGFDDKNIKVVYNGIDPRRFPISTSRSADRKALGIEDGAFVVTYAGRIHPVKGLETLVEAFSRIRGKQKSRLIISGEPAQLILPDGTRRRYMSELKSLVEKLSIKDDVIWMEHCSDIPKLFGMSDAVVLPSLWSEPFGRVLIEAMSCGVPALGAASGGIPEILTGEFEKFLFKPGSADELAAGLQELSGWRKKDPGLADRCRQHVMKQFSVKKTIEGVEKVMLDTLGKKS